MTPPIGRLASEVVGDYFNYRTIFHGHSGHFTITLQCVANMKDGASQRIS